MNYEAAIHFVVFFNKQGKSNYVAWTLKPKPARPFGKLNLNKDVLTGRLVCELEDVVCSVDESRLAARTSAKDVNKGPFSLINELFLRKKKDELIHTLKSAAWR